MATRAEVRASFPEVAAAIRRGKAESKQIGGRLAEKPPPGAKEDWWVQRARFLRTQAKPRMSYQAIADRLGHSYQEVYRSLNPQRAAAQRARYEHKHRPTLSKRQVAARRKLAPVCEECGEPMNRKQVSTRLCQPCRNAKGAAATERIVELALTGLTYREIGEIVGRPENSIGAVLSKARRRGAAVPRRKPLPEGKRDVGSHDAPAGEGDRGLLD